MNSTHNDRTFFTNEKGQTLLDRFKSTLKDTRFFDVLVGYFRSSGFYHLYESIEPIDKTRILIGLGKSDRARACYLHACLRYVQHDYMTNTTLRERFGIEDKNSATASRIIKDTLKAELIRCYDDSVGNKAKKYLPWWA
jgi:predicted HTH transcriptional regulator